MSSEHIGDLLLVLWQRWRSASPVKRGAITREQYWILRTLSERGEMKIKDIASAIGCTPGSASIAVKRLERGGLVRRERGEKDERVVTVTLAKRGASKLESWRGEQLVSMSALFEPLSPKEKRALSGILEKALVTGGDLPMPGEDARGKRS
ncbi:MAG TPA: MarR family transcriptional regulator [Nitrososphaerales archaeon]|nr:MarR family transcriptional regulator [Nitrososphaerales archaeon]